MVQEEEPPGGSFIRGSRVPAEPSRSPPAGGFPRPSSFPGLRPDPAWTQLYPFAWDGGSGALRGVLRGQHLRSKGKKRLCLHCLASPSLPAPSFPSSPPRPLLFRPAGSRGRAVCVCVYACTRVCARARWCCSSVCAFGMWLVVGCVCAAHVLTRVLGVECICFALGHGVCVLCGVCVCTLVDCTFLLDYSVSMWVRSGCGCV